MAANFIADPEEWRDRRPTKIGDNGWNIAYTEFKSRFHWLFLWNNEVQVIDTFVLFNRQFEHWFSLAEPSLVEKMFAEHAFNVAFRNYPKAFQTLREIDEEQVRGNPDFRWFFWGRPDLAFVVELSRKLSQMNYPIQYEAKSRPGVTRDCFRAALEKTERLESMYDQFKDLRERLDPKVSRLLLNTEEYGWRRSALYTRLGLGVDEDGRDVKEGADLAEQPIEVRNELKRLVDWCWYIAIDDSLQPLASRFPTRTPPTAFFSVLPRGDTFNQEKNEAIWMQHALQNVDAGSVVFDGDRETLFSRFRDLPFDRVWKLRESSEFRDYRSLYESYEKLEAEVTGSNVRRLFDLSNAIVRAMFRCLVALGKECGVTIKESPVGQRTLRFLAKQIGTNRIIWGLVLLDRMQRTPVTEEIVQARVSWFTARILRIGTREKPLHAYVQVLGPIWTREGNR